MPVKILIAGVTTAVLSSCGSQSTPCEISPSENLGQKGGSCPLTVYSFNPDKVISAEDRATLRNNYGADLKSLYQWIAVNNGAASENSGDGTVAFSTYTFENGRSMVVFPNANEDYNSGQSEKHEYTSSLFETADGKILQSYNYQDELNPGKVISFFTIEYAKPDGVSLEELSKDPSKLGTPAKIILSNPPANESITYTIDSNNPDHKKLIEAIASIFSPGTGVAHALGEGTATPPPTETATAIPPTATALPPTETPVVRVELDQPMTTKFDLLNTEVMPSTNEGMVRSGDLNEAVRQYWQETGLINPDGSINKPENVVPAKPDLWRILHDDGDPAKNYPPGNLILGPFNNGNQMIDGAFQPTDLLFKVKNNEGEVTGVLVTEILYYIDPNGKIAVEPVFFFIDISKTSNTMMAKLLGHEKFKDGKIDVLWPFVGVKDGEEGQEFNIARFIEDKNAYLSEPMQEDREAFAQQVDETGNPKGMGDFWWAGIVTSSGF